MKSILPLVATIGLLSIANATKTYNQDQGYQAMYYSGAAYCNQTYVQTWNCGEACSAEPTKEITIVSNPKAGTFGYTGYNPHTDTIVLSFRGSVDISNWMTNLDYYRVSYPYYTGALVHEGFYTAYTAVQDQVIAQIQALISSHKTASLLVTGHSLGAALATIAALDIKHKISNFPNAFHFYTFGSPRCGNQEFSDYVNTVFSNGAYSRVTHYDDPVPHLPLELQGFAHGGNEVWYNQNAYSLGYVECENTAGAVEDHSCSDSLILKFGVSNHLIYLGKNINKLCSTQATIVEPEQEQAAETIAFLA